MPYILSFILYTLSKLGTGCAEASTMPYTLYFVPYLSWVQGAQRPAPCPLNLDGALRYGVQPIDTGMYSL